MIFNRNVLMFNYHEATVLSLSELAVMIMVNEGEFHASWK